MAAYGHDTQWTVGKHDPAAGCPATKTVGTQKPAKSPRTGFMPCICQCPPFQQTRLTRGPAQYDHNWKGSIMLYSPGSFSGVRRAMGWGHGLATLSRKGRRAPPATLSVRKPRQGPRRFLKHADISTKTVEVLVCLAVGRSTIRIGSGPGMPEYRRRTPQRSPGPVSGYESMPTVIACPWPYAG